MGAIRALFILILALFLVVSSGLEVVPDTSTSWIRSPNDKRVVISIKDQPAIKDVMQTTMVRTTRMVDADGQAYTCRLPLRRAAGEPQDDLSTSHLESESDLGSQVAGSASTALLQPAGPALDELEVEIGSSSLKTPEQLLEKLSSLCFFRQEGLWTYETCYKKHTRQYRQALQRLNTGGAQSQAISSEDFSCGKYNEEDQDLTVRFDASVTGMPMRYVRHILTDGAECTLTGARRLSEVRFTCLPQHTENLLVLVKEFPTCHYIFVVATPLLCDHPAFRPPPDRTHAIHCVKEDSATPAGVDELPHPEASPSDDQLSQEGSKAEEDPASSESDDLEEPSEDGEDDSDSAIEDTDAEDQGECPGGEGGEGTCQNQ